MLKFLLVTVILIFNFTNYVLTLPQSRIIGGRQVDISKHPYLVSIRYRFSANDSYVHKCAGSIYNEKVVLTAAQCLVDIGSGEKLMVVAGANTRKGMDGMPYPVKKWIAHANYSPWTVDYDIGILFIDDVFDLSHINIARIDIRNSRPLDGTMATVAGWGYREEFGPSSNVLEEVQVPIVNSEECSKSYGDGEITERMICAGYMDSGGKDACQGDTGGPLIVQSQLVGLVSWGIGCARPKYPSVYTFAGSLKQWVDETIAENVV